MNDGPTTQQTIEPSTLKVSLPVWFQMTWKESEARLSRENARSEQYELELRILGDQLKQRLVDAVRRRDEQSVLEVYYRLVEVQEWRDAVRFSDWSTEVEKDEWMRACEAQIYKQWDEPLLAIVGEVIRGRLVSAVQEGNTAVVLELCWRLVDQDNENWVEAAIREPGYCQWSAVDIRRVDDGHLEIKNIVPCRVVTITNEQGRELLAKLAKKTRPTNVINDLEDGFSYILSIEHVCQLRTALEACL